MTKPRDSARASGEGRGASALQQQATRWQQLWSRAQRTRPWRAFSRFTDVGGNVLAAGMSYQALFAIFAALYIGFGLVGIWLRGRPELLEQLVDQINLFVPGLIGDDEGGNGIVSLNAVLQTRAIDWTSIVAGVSLLWVAMTWFTGTRRAIRIIFDLEVTQYRNAALLKLRDLVLALGFFVAILISAGLTVLSTSFMDSVIGWLGWDPENWLVGGLGTVTRYAAMYVFDLLVLVAIHYFLAEVRVGRWRLLTGCALGSAALFGLKVLGATLLSGTTSNPLLASFAVLVGLLVWFNLICRVLLLTATWIATGADRELGLPEG
ncbi:YihY/virulence factor BrkB family protein [Leucobacter zeae]|nr:YihY/virulence factor BrkB family protein [Leucobacter zeae]